MKLIPNSMVCLFLLLSFARAADPPMVSKADAGRRVGIIGLDTSHAVEFTRALNAADAPVDQYGGLRVVAAYPQGSRDIQSSTSRVPAYTKQMKEWGVGIVETIPDLLGKVDFIMLESNDGRVHREQAKLVIEAGKPLFIDKPVAASLPDVIAIYQAANARDVPVFSASSLRWIPRALELRDGKMGAITGADTFSWAALEPTHPDLYWYGIHGVEILYTVMGTGCQTVSRFHTADTEFCVGQWKNGRIGTFRGLRSSEHKYGGTVFSEKKITYLPMETSYAPLLHAIAQFFVSGKSPVSQEETLEIYAFMSAADQSKANGGRPVKIFDVMNAAAAKVAAEKND